MNSTVELSKEFLLVVDYTKTIEQAITDGKYGLAFEDVRAKNFPIFSEMIGKRVEVATKLFYFNHNINSDDVISGMDKDGYRPANLMELLALGILFPELQRQLPIVAIGSICRDAVGYRCVPYLRVIGDQRQFNWSQNVDAGWNAHCCFLGVRK